jgi:Glycosyltransferase WbsX
MKNKIKLIAMYFPQLHAIAENDEWWGKGFTDWNNVKTAVPQIDGQYQPRIPKDNNYYDQSKIETIRAQVKLAKDHGLYGFCHYHYWFDGKQLLETPTNLMLEHKDIDFPFCLSWANETWSRRWDAQEHQMLIQQTHPPTKESWRKHYDYLIKAWKDPRAIKVEGKPVFVIYRPQRIEKIDEMLAYWKELAIADGLKGLYFIFQKQFELPKRDSLKSFDAIFQFQPFEAIYAPEIFYKNPENKQYHWLYRFFRIYWFVNLICKIYTYISQPFNSLTRFARYLPDPLRAVIKNINATFFPRLTFYDYEKIWEKITDF